MLKVDVPKDLDAIESKILLGLTKRQIICFGLGAIVSLPVYYLTKQYASGGTASMCMIFLVIPFIFFAMYKRNGQTPEKILMNIYRMKYQKPGIRKYEYRKKYENNIK